MEQSVLDTLREISNSRLPMHMPGHKRNPALAPYLKALASDLDLTEIPGLDNLNDPQDLLLRSMELTASLWGSRRAMFTANGGTGGVLAAIHAAVPRGGKLLMARNSHLSAYHAVELRSLRPVYLLPETTDSGICLAVPPDAVRRALQEDSDVSAVFLTSPTYEGVLSDISAIAEICHSFGVPLLVDEAHGAHLGLTSDFPKGAIACGADVVVHSLHKTLSGLTQTAVVHLCSDRVGEDRLFRAVSIYQSSSPSYLLTASMDGCVRLLQERGAELLHTWRLALDRFRARCSELRCLRLAELGSSDPSKLVILTDRCRHTGTELAGILRDAYHIETEMSSAQYVLAMTGIGDTEQSMDRLADALQAIDDTLIPAGQEPLPALPLPEKVFRPSDAETRTGKETALQDAVGRVSLSYLWAYPPGVPLLVPGEVVSAEAAILAARMRQAGVQLSNGGKIIAEKMPAALE